MKIIGHGGAAGKAPRNTLAALEQAITADVDEVEFDVRVTADNIPVVHHHLEMVASDGSSVSIRDTNYSTLLLIDKNLATLESALKFINNRTIAHLEIKPGENIVPIVVVIQSYLESSFSKPNDLLLASRSGKTLRQLHQALPDIPISVIEFWSTIRAVHRARMLDTKRIDLLEYWLWTGVIRNLTRYGYQISSFNSVYPNRARIMSLLRRSGQSNDPRRLIAWQKAGLYGVITDYPSRFKRPID